MFTRRQIQSRLKRGLAVFLSASLAFCCTNSTFAMRTAKHKDDSKPTSHITRTYVTDVLIHEYEIEAADLGICLDEVLKIKKDVGSFKYDIATTLQKLVAVYSDVAVHTITASSGAGVASPIIADAVRALSLPVLKALCNAAIRGVTKIQLKKIMPQIQNSIRVKVYYSGGWDEECHCSNPLTCKASCKIDYYPTTQVVLEAY